MGSHRVAFGSARRLTSLSVACFLALAAAAHAGPDRSRLSRDLAESIDRGQGTFRVIVQGSADTVNAVAQRHGARVAKALKTGAVIEVTREALEAMSADPDAGHLAGDTVVRSMMAVSAQAMGADQAWAAALSGVGAATGGASAWRSSTRASRRTAR